MKPDIKNLSLKDLINLKDEIEKQIKIKKKEEKSNLLKKFKKLSEEAGFDSINEIIETKKDTPKGKLEAKYKNPLNEKQVWSGKGRKPKWLEEELKKGKKLDDFLIVKG